MKNIKDVVVLVQARLGSQRIPRKMLKPVGGTNLFEICLGKLNRLKSIKQSQIYVSVWEEELKETAIRNQINIFHRSETSANSEGTPMTEMYEWWDKLPFKYCVLINGCAPFLEPETIDDFIEAYTKSDSDGMFGVIEKKNYFWNSNGVFLTPLKEDVMNTKLAKPVYEAAHCLYAGRLNKIGRGIWMGEFSKPNDIELYPLAEKECFDIDYPWQFDLYKSIHKNKEE